MGLWQWQLWNTHSSGKAAPVLTKLLNLFERDFALLINFQQWLYYRGLYCMLFYSAVLKVSLRYLPRQLQLPFCSRMLLWGPCTGVVCSQLCRQSQQGSSGPQEQPAACQGEGQREFVWAHQEWGRAWAERACLVSLMTLLYFWGWGSWGAQDSWQWICGRHWSNIPTYGNSSLVHPLCASMYAVCRYTFLVVLHWSCTGKIPEVWGSSCTSLADHWLAVGKARNGTSVLDASEASIWIWKWNLRFLPELSNKNMIETCLICQAKFY